jgi:hypothetical protein
MLQINVLVKYIKQQQLTKLPNELGRNLSKMENIKTNSDLLL